MAQKQTPVDIINSVMNINELIKDESCAKAQYAKIAQKLEAAGYAEIAAK